MNKWKPTFQRRESTGTRSPALFLKTTLQKEHEANKMFAFKIFLNVCKFIFVYQYLMFSPLFIWQKEQLIFLFIHVGTLLWFLNLTHPVPVLSHVRNLNYKMAALREHNHWTVNYTFRYYLFIPIWASQQNTRKKKPSMVKKYFFKILKIILKTFSKSLFVYIQSL